MKVLVIYDGGKLWRYEYDPANMPEWIVRWLSQRESETK